MRKEKAGLLRFLLRNLLGLWQFRLLRFRLITFGLYEPHPLYGGRVIARPTWQVNPRVAWLLLCRTPAYAGWLAEMEAVKQGGAAGWWERRVGSEGIARLRAWMDAENAR